MTEKKILIKPDSDLAEEAVWYKGKLIEYLHAGREALNTRDIQALTTIGHRMMIFAGHCPISWESPGQAKIPRPR